jgi:hypothetical protein
MVSGRSPFGLISAGPSIVFDEGARTKVLKVDYICVSALELAADGVESIYFTPMGMESPENHPLNGLMTPIGADLRW